MSHPARRITASDVARWFEPYCGIPAETAAGIAATLIAEAACEPPSRPHEPPETEARRLLLRRLQARRRSITATSDTDQIGTMLRTAQLDRLDRQIVALRASLPRRPNAATVEWTSIAIAVDRVAARLLVEAGYPPRRIDATALRIAQKALRALNYSRSDRAIEREVTKLRRGLRLMLSHLSRRQKTTP